MATIREQYSAVDMRGAHDGSIWPASVPALTGPEALRAGRRLWRFAMGETFSGRVEITSGNRSNWMRGGVLYVNPGKGWRELVHDLSHYFVYRANPGERPHSKFHGRFEAKLAREVVRRGWLDGKLRDRPKAATVARPADALHDKRRAMLARIDAGLERWERKAERARRALAKLAKRRRYYARALG